MTYGYIYVAQIALGANMTQAVKAIAEAEAYPGPSIIIGYAPCELHGVKGGMTNCQNEMKKAVEAGYWNLFTFNPARRPRARIRSPSPPRLARWTSIRSSWLTRPVTAA